MPFCKSNYSLRIHEGVLYVIIFKMNKYKLANIHKTYGKM